MTVPTSTPTVTTTATTTTTTPTTRSSTPLRRTRATPASKETSKGADTRVVLYALGGGHGHAVRALAVARRLRALDASLTPLVVIPERLAAWAAAEQVPSLLVPSDVDRAGLAALLGQSLPTSLELLLVDVFPRGVLGELIESLGERRPRLWLVARRVDPRFYAQPAVSETLRARFEKVIWCEEPSVLPASIRLEQQRVEPVVARDPEECLNRDAARAALGVASDEALLLGLGAGSEGEQVALLRLLGKIERRLRPGGKVRLLFFSRSLERRDGAAVLSHYPAMSYLRAADVVVSGGGYAAYHETRALGVPAIFVARHRRYDDQAWRVREAAAPSGPLELEQAVARALESEAGRTPVRSGGAHEIATAVAAALGEGRVLKPRPSSAPA